jgi:hypothetical protein
MFFNLKYRLATISILLIGYGCSPALYKPIPEDATDKVSYQQLFDGRLLYVNNCGSCHSLHLPTQFSEKVWKLNLDEMQERAHINDSQKELILTYLLHKKIKAEGVISNPGQ